MPAFSSALQTHSLKTEDLTNYPDQILETLCAGYEGLESF